MDGQRLLVLFASAWSLSGFRCSVARSGEGDPDVRMDLRMAPRLIAVGLGVGFLSGFFGIGGGFLIVPGLVFGSGMPILNAVGSSLFSVGVFGLTTAANYAVSGLVDWRVAALFIAGGVVGGMVGMRLAIKLASQRGLLVRVFAVVLFAVAAYMLYRSVGPMVGRGSDSPVSILPHDATVTPDQTTGFVPGPFIPNWKSNGSAMKANRTLLQKRLSRLGPVDRGQPAWRLVRPGPAAARPGIRPSHASGARREPARPRAGLQGGDDRHQGWRGRRSASRPGQGGAAGQSAGRIRRGGETPSHRGDPLRPRHQRRPDGGRLEGPRQGRQSHADLIARLTRAGVSRARLRPGPGRRQDRALRGLA